MKDHGPFTPGHEPGRGCHDIALWADYRSGPADTVDVDVYEHCLQPARAKATQAASKILIIHTIIRTITHISTGTRTRIPITAHRIRWRPTTRSARAL